MRFPQLSGASGVTAALGSRANTLSLHTVPSSSSLIRSAQDCPSSRSEGCRIQSWAKLERRRSPNTANGDLTQLCTGAKTPLGTNSSLALFCLLFVYSLGGSWGKLIVESHIWEPHRGHLCVYKYQSVCHSDTTQKPCDYFLS